MQVNEKQNFHLPSNRTTRLVLTLASDPKQIKSSLRIPLLSLRPSIFLLHMILPWNQQQPTTRKHHPTNCTTSASGQLSCKRSLKHPEDLWAFNPLLFPSLHTSILFLHQLIEHFSHFFRSPLVWKAYTQSEKTESWNVLFFFCSIILLLSPQSFCSVKFISDN